MSQKILVAASALALFSTIFIGCRSGQPIDYDTALGLLKDRNSEPVRLTFSASPPANAGAGVMDAYERLIDAHVLACTNTAAMGKVCQPGPAGDALTQTGASELALVAGRWVPASITSISRSVGTSATAEVRMTFEMSPLYRDFEDAFDTIQIWAGKSVIESKKEGKIAHAVFQRDDDGWHLENVSL